MTPLQTIAYRILEILYREPEVTLDSLYSRFSGLKNIELVTWALSHFENKNWIIIDSREVIHLTSQGRVIAVKAVTGEAIFINLPRKTKDIFREEFPELY